jgi:DNA polymerase II
MRWMGRRGDGIGAVSSERETTLRSAPGIQRGWLLDVYPQAEDLAVWVLGEDGARQQLTTAFPVSFYVAGPDEALRQLWRFLRQQPDRPRLERAERRELFQDAPVTTLAVEATGPAAAERLFRAALEAFPRLEYYDTDLPVSLRFAARWGAFPLAFCRWETNGAGRLLAVECLESAWDLEPEMAPLRTLIMELDEDPQHAEPRRVRLECGRYSYCLDLAAPRPLLVNLRAILNRHDPDLLLTRWGDTWLLPRLLDLAQERRLPLPLNRDAARPPEYKDERSYFSYGQIIHRGQQVHLFGRWHIDAQNAVLYDDYGLTGVLESARVTGLPVQTAARVSPGSGISALQTLTALHIGVMSPWRKQQAEHPKSALDLIRGDQGGLVYQPLVGLHRSVAEIDFMSMYPSIMARFNISPETVGRERPTAQTVPELAVIKSGPPGLIPTALQPLLDKRLALKGRLADMPAWDPRRKLFKARAAAHKWLLVTCFGYLGYKNARFGQIEAHEAVTAYGREALLRAKEAAEDMGFTVLHMYVDGLWVCKEGASQPRDFQALLEAVLERTRLPAALEGVYRWVAFLPSRVNASVPVANRYFGVFQDGSLKMRGIEARRRDTPAFIAEMQVQMIEHLAHEPADRAAAADRAVGLVRRTLRDLRQGRIPLEKMVTSQRISRELDEYRSPSPAARAAAQLAGVGKHLRPGQRVRFLYTRGEPGVYAWDLPEPVSRAALDVARYTELLLRAGGSVLGPFGIGEAALRLWVQEGERVRPLRLGERPTLNPLA